MTSESDFEHPGIDQRFLYDLGIESTRVADRYNSRSVTLDIAFLVYLQKLSRFGFFTFGPVTIDVHLVEDIIDRTIDRGREGGEAAYSEDFVRFTRQLVEEVRVSGRKRLDELHLLLAFMRVGEGLPARVFGELGVTPEQVEAYARDARRGQQPGSLEQLYTPEEAADYLGVHVQTVRGWIRSGRLPASRLTGQRALRIRASDLAGVLEPVSAEELDSDL